MNAVSFTELRTYLKVKYLEPFANLKLFPIHCAIGYISVIV